MIVETREEDDTLDVDFFIAVETVDGGPVVLPTEDIEGVFNEFSEEIAEGTGAEGVQHFSIMHVI